MDDGESSAIMPNAHWRTMAVTFLLLEGVLLVRIWLDGGSVWLLAFGIMAVLYAIIWGTLNETLFHGEVWV